MRIAVLGFGCLVNNPLGEVEGKGLHCSKPKEKCPPLLSHKVSAESPFAVAEGLKLPMLLGRVSNKGTDRRRFTIVLHQGAAVEQVFYAHSKFTKLDDAIKNLREREGIAKGKEAKIGYVNLVEGHSRSRIDGIVNLIAAWALDTGYEAVIWSDLAARGVELAPQSRGLEIISLLEEDFTLLANTKAYIRELPNYPNQLQSEILGLADPIRTNLLDEVEYEASLTDDFDERDCMPQTNVAEENWFLPRCGRWGPPAKKFPQPNIPFGVDSVMWKRDRIVEAAKHFIGLRYQREGDDLRAHFPARGCGLDCSNFAAWVYNYALGIQFASDVDIQIVCDAIGREVSPEEPLERGDLVYFNGFPRHVVIYVDKNHIIDSANCGSNRGVRLVDTSLKANRHYRPERGNPNFLRAKRFIE